MDKIAIGSTFVAGFIGSFIGAACGWILFAPVDKPVVISYDSELTSGIPSTSNLCDSIIDNHTNIVQDSDKKED